MTTVTLPKSDYPDPTPEMLTNPLFNTIWQVIKKWDIDRHRNGLIGGATGNDARRIYDAVVKLAMEDVNQFDITGFRLEPEVKTPVKVGKIARWVKMADRQPSVGGTYHVGRYIEDGIMPRRFKTGEEYVIILRDGPKWSGFAGWEYWLDGMPSHPEYKG